MNCIIDRDCSQAHPQVMLELSSYSENLTKMHVIYLITFLVFVCVLSQTIMFEKVNIKVKF